MDRQMRAISNRNSAWHGILHHLSAWLPRPAAGRARGQALDEFALLATWLVIFVVAIIDFGRVFYFDIEATAGAMGGVKAASRGENDTTITSEARQAIPAAVRNSFNVSVTPACGSRVAAPTPAWATVTVTYAFTPLTPVGAWVLGGSTYTITRSASMKVRVDCV
jgi:Flp pilus assembly protein TadG